MQSVELVYAYHLHGRCTTLSLFTDTDTDTYGTVTNIQRVRMNCHSTFLRNCSLLCVISGCCRKVNENCTLLGYHAASSGNILNDVSGQSIGPTTPWSLDHWRLDRRFETIYRSRETLVPWPMKMGPTFRDNLSVPRPLGPLTIEDCTDVSGQSIGPMNPWSLDQWR